MKIGLIGLGRMGLAIATRLVKNGIEVIGFDQSNDCCKAAAEAGVKIIHDVAKIAEQVRIIWLMVPEGKPVDDVIESLQFQLQKGTIIIDGGNSLFRDSIRRATDLAKIGVNFLDCGTSGGLHGKTIGFSLMIGGNKKAFESALPVFEAIAAPQGFAYMGPAGTGHYVKMVHNGIEYALLQSYAEGFDLLKNGYYKEINVANAAKVWTHGSIIRSWILNLSYEILSHDQDLNDVSGAIGENKTGQWTVDVAKEYNVPVDLIEKSLTIRAWSRQSGGNYATKLVAMLRNKFGGHAVTKKGLL
jgi:6-phosphogluconate dehydrogenase